MQWLASLCIRQPVLTWVLMLVIVVVGSRRLPLARRRSVPEDRLPPILVTTTLHGAAPEEVETEHHRQDRGRGQHDQRHRRAALDVERGCLAGHHRVHARQGHRRRGARGARPHQQRAPASCRKGIDQPVVIEDRSGRGADPARHACARRASHPRLTELADKTRAPADREHQRRRPGDDPRRAQAADQPLARSAEAAGRGAHRGRRGARARATRT